MNDRTQHEESVEEVWRTMLTTGRELDRRWRRVFRLFPGDPRCKQCFAPLSGVGAPLVRILWNKGPSSMNPYYCDDCEVFAREHLGGAEVELAMLFADVRGSTSLAESRQSAEYSRLIDRFYKTATDVLINADAFIEKLIGDEVTGLFFPGFAGENYTQVAVNAARELMRATSHREDKRPWIPIGIGVHQGTAFVGAVGSKGSLVEITALGDAVNVAARLAQEASAGEIVASEEACRTGGLDYGEYEARVLSLKGRSAPISVRIIND